MANPFTGGAAGFSGIDYLAPEVAQQQREIQRQQAIADLLRQQSLEDNNQTQFAGGWAIPNSGVKRLSGLGQALLSGYMQRKIDDRQAAVAQQLAERLGGVSYAPASQSGSATDTLTQAGTATSAPIYDGSVTAPSYDSRKTVAPGAAGVGGIPSLNTLMTLQAMGINVPPEVVSAALGFGKKEFHSQNLGSQTQNVVFDPITGKTTVDSSFTNTASPDAKLSAGKKELKTLNLGDTTQNLVFDPLTGTTTVAGAYANNASPDAKLSAATSASAQRIDAAKAAEPKYMTGPDGAVYAMPGALVPGYSSVMAPANGPAGATLPAGIAPVTGNVPLAGARPAAAPSGLMPVVPGKTVATKAAEEAAIEKAKKEAANAAEATQKREGPAFGVKEVISQARGLLNGVDVRATANNNDETVKVATPTGSVIGSGLDWGASLIGAAPDSAVTAERLRVLSGKLIQSVPRFEGSQSDADRKSYEELAGRVGDSSIPIKRRLAALDELEAIVAPYDRSAPSNTTNGWSIRPVGK